MSLATLEKAPPPLFHQGPTARTKLAFFTALAIFLMVADTRFQFAKPVRATVATLLLPVQRALLWPVQAVRRGHEYAQGLDDALVERDAAKRQMAALAERAAKAETLVAENERLRALLELHTGLKPKAVAAQVMYSAKDPFSRKVFVDKGGQHGVLLGAPVLNESGVLGQVTRVYPLTSEVTLLTDAQAAIPVINQRTQQRSAAFGGSGGLMELRFMPSNADVQVGDTLTTSGMDGIYPAGLAVAKVHSVERRGETGFARILLQPDAPSDGVRHVLILEPAITQLAPPLEPPPESTRGGRVGTGRRP